MPGALWIVGALAVLSAFTLFGAAGTRSDTLSMWMFARVHKLMYDPMIERFEAEGRPIDVRVLSIPALERRMMGGFLSGMPTADVLEVERRIANRAFAGPLHTVGFLDLTDRLQDSGLIDELNTPSLGPWTSRGRVFGLPHDVHPVLLAYRADIVEAAGIDVSEIETWADFERVMAPLLRRAGDPGVASDNERYLLPLGVSAPYIDVIEMLLLQAGGGFFDETGAVRIDSPENERVLIELVRWTTGPTRIAGDAPEFDPTGNQLKLDGYVVGIFMPDWLCSIYKAELPQLSGKLKVMPMPAWDPGGRRTSVWGGTMLGISKNSGRVDEAWAFASELYFTRELAHTLFRDTDIITPVTRYWNDPIFDEPDAFFAGQPKGRLYIDAAPDVPVRISSPYTRLAKTALQTAFVRLRDYADAQGTTDREALRPEAKRLLAEAHRAVADQAARNVFLTDPQPEHEQ